MPGNLPIRTASTMMLVREAPTIEVLMVKRNYAIDHFSGAMVFPGGKVEPADMDPAWAAQVHGWDDIPDSERGPRISAIRETFEECGILPAVQGYAADPEGTKALRSAMDRGEASFLAYLQQHGLRPDLRALSLFSRWRTPPVVAKRFDTYFYLVEAPADQVALADGRETISAEWIAAGTALDMAAQGERTIVFPTRMNLSLLARTASIADAVAAAALRPAHIVEPEIEMHGGERFLRLHDADGYGPVLEPLHV
ncbi:NUDIX domain-containing protein [Paracoccus sp. FO-3]|uniref:NUDIX hydrolase n=1 Tax=Paracoccus sp. FO-3 TaxID=1335059 RepID=UPI00112858D1|nr:NUDIX domain-containing protein [Paracoccus sp. FO-3]